MGYVVDVCLRMDMAILSIHSSNFTGKYIHLHHFGAGDPSSLTPPVTHKMKVSGTKFWLPDLCFSAFLCARFGLFMLDDLQATTKQIGPKKRKVGGDLFSKSDSKIHKL